MCTGEQQRQTLVGDFRFRRGGVETFHEDPQFFARRLAAPAPSVDIDHFSPRDGEEPRFRVRGTAIRRPVPECGGEGFRQGVFGLRYVPRPRGEEGDELAVAAAGDLVRRLTGLLVAFHVVSSRRYMGQIGRTSTTPWFTVGQRAAHESAASRSGASMR